MNSFNSIFDKLHDVDHLDVDDEQVVDDIAITNIIHSTQYGTDIWQPIIEYLDTHKISKYKRNTVGEYLYGCFNDDVCSPSCIRGFKILSDNCNFPVYEKYNNELHKVNNIKGGKAYIFMSTKDS